MIKFCTSGMFSGKFEVGNSIIDFVNWALKDELASSDKTVTLKMEVSGLGCDLGSHQGNFTFDDHAKEASINLCMNDTYQLGDYLHAVAHEVVHVKQWLNGRLRHDLVRTPEGTIEWGFQWEGFVYRSPKTIEAYMQCPWEVEAFSLASNLVNNYMHWLEFF